MVGVRVVWLFFIGLREGVSGLVRFNIEGVLGVVFCMIL